MKISARAMCSKFGDLVFVSLNIPKGDFCVEPISVVVKRMFPSEKEGNSAVLKDEGRPLGSACRC